MYLPTQDRDLEAMLAALAWPEERLAETTFVDIGSGKGRVVLLAAMREFREVVGVELAPSLHEVAQHNLEIVRATGALVAPTRLVLGDAADLAVPSGPCVFYLYHPFRASVANVVVARIIASLAADPRPAAIIYGHPTLQARLGAEVFAQRGVFGVAAEGGRQTARFHMGWTVWTNDAWLAAARTGSTRAA